MLGEISAAVYNLFPGGETGAVSREKAQGIHVKQIIHHSLEWGLRVGDNNNVAFNTIIPTNANAKLKVKRGRLVGESK